jgi:hypothetical protein
VFEGGWTKAEAKAGPPSLSLDIFNELTLHSWLPRPSVGEVHSEGTARRPAERDQCKTSVSTSLRQLSKYFRWQYPEVPYTANSDAVVFPAGAPDCIALPETDPVVRFSSPRFSLVRRCATN